MADNSFAANLVNAYLNNTIDEFIVSCQSPYEGCGDTKLSAGDAASLQDVIKDGVITQEERAKLGFLPPEVVSGIAGDDGKKLIELRAGMLISKLSKANLKDVGQYIEQIAELGPGAAAQFLPVAKTLLDRLIPAVKKERMASNRISNEIDKVESRISDVKDRIEFLPKEEDCNLPDSNAARQLCAKQDALYERRDQLDAKLEDDVYYPAFIDLVDYLKGLTPPPDFLVPAIRRGVRNDTPDFVISYATVDILLEMKSPEAMDVLRKIYESYEEDYENSESLKDWAKLMLKFGNAADIEKAADCPDIAKDMFDVFSSNPRPELEAAIVKKVTGGGGHDEEDYKSFSKACAKLTFTSLKSIVESHADDTLSALAIREMGKRFPKEECLPTLLKAAAQDEKYPMSAEVATKVLASIKQGKGK